MSRIISGAAGGVRLASVPGDNTRPTTDRVKESLFSKLESYDIIRDARVLDAFGGSGALGCEALSRGAASARGTWCLLTRPTPCRTSRSASYWRR